jgi:phosphatidylinositol 4-kinase B
MQAHLKDISRPDHTSESFLVCQRVLNQCHEIIYGDLPSSGTPYTTLNSVSLGDVIRKKIWPNASPALVGIGLVLAGAPAMPSLTQIMGEVALEQGRIDSQGHDLRSLDHHEEFVRTRSGSAEDNQEDDGEDDGTDSGGRNTPSRAVVPPPERTQSLSVSGTPKSGGRSRSQTIAAQTSPALPLHLRDLRKPRLSEDPFGQNDSQSVDTPSLPSPFQSTPTFSAARNFRRSNNMVSADTLLQKYDVQTQTFLLRTHFCRSEVCVDSYFSVMLL